MVDRKKKRKVYKAVLKKNTRSPKVPDYQIQGAQRKAYMKEIKLSGRPKAKVSHLRHLGALRAQPWSILYLKNVHVVSGSEKITGYLCPNKTTFEIHGNEPRTNEVMSKLSHIATCSYLSPQ